MDDITSTQDGIVAPDADSDARNDPGRPARSHWLTTTAIVAATILAVVSATTTWVRTQALDTDQWVALSSEVLAEPDVQQALAAYLTDELFVQADVTQELASALPDQLSGLAGPLTAALRPPATDAVGELIGSPRFAQAWARANRVTHQTLVAVLRGESTELVATSGGAITLDLGDALAAVGANLGVSEATLARIPPDAGQVVIFQSDELASVQRTVQVLDALSWFLFVVVVALYALAVVAARDRRRESLRGVGVGLMVAGVSVLLLRAISIRTGVDVLVADAGNRELAAVVGQVGTRLLQHMAWAGILYGVLFVAFAWLLGPHRWARRVRHGLARWSDSTAALAAGAIVAFLFLVWLSPGGALDRWTLVLVLAGLAVGAVVMLQAQLGRDLERLDDAPDESVRTGG